MNKKIVFSILFIFTFFYVANLKTTYYQGVNYNVRIVKIPLYLKVLDFFSRHYHYRELTGEITKDCRTKKEKIFALFDWTHQNIHDIPDGLPVIDDHAWHIIIRGYGAADQSADVFTTLCNYAHINAFFTFVSSSQNKNNKIPLSLVKTEEGWLVFDTFNGIYFSKRNSDEPANIEAIKSGAYSISGIASVNTSALNYAPYIVNIPLVKDMALGRSNVQSPLNRLFYEIKKKCS